MFKKFMCVGIAVHDLKRAMSDYRAMFGLQPLPAKRLRLPVVDSGRLDAGDCYLEFLEPSSNDDGQRSDVAAFLREHGEGVFALGFAVDNLEDKVRALESKGVSVMRDVEASCASIGPEHTNGVRIDLHDSGATLAARRATKGMLKGFDHLGIAVKDMTKAVVNYGDVLGLPRIPWQTKTSGVQIAKFSVGGEFLALLQPVGDSQLSGAQSNLARHLEKNGEGVYQVCFVVDNVKNALDTLAAKGVPVIAGEKMSSTMGAKLGFVEPQAAHGVFIELVEKSG